MKTKCGYVAIIGRSNVGKSTLLNKILGKSLSITSRKPQTTRDRILGIKTVGNVQTIYLDTPGIHGKAKLLLNRRMNREAFAVFATVDVLVFLCDATSWTDDDELACSKIMASTFTPPKVIVAINKIDLLPNKKTLLPLIAKLTHKITPAAVIPISAKKGIQIDELEVEIKRLLPQRPHEFQNEQLTNMSMAFLIAERVREKIMRFTAKEVPYHTAVIVTALKEAENIIHAEVLILVAKTGQKAIIVGKGGMLLKEIGTRARLDLEKFLGKKVFLNLWVKVKPDWLQQEKMLGQLEREVR